MYARRSCQYNGFDNTLPENAQSVIFKSMSEYRVVITTCPDQSTADDLAAYLVDHGLAACVNVIPGMRSYYQWKGEVCNDAEFVLLIKTRTVLYPRLEESIVERHPYELPEVIALPIESGLDGYLRWVDEQTGK